MTTDLTRFLTRVSLFEGLDEAQLLDIAGRGTELSVQRGDLVCRQGDPGVSMFIVTAGLVEVFVDAGGERRVLATLASGDYFGEMSLLSGLPRSASVRALAPSRVFGLTKGDFAEACRRSPAIALDIIRTLSLRLARSNTAAGEARRDARVVVLLSLDQGLGRTPLAANLALALARRGLGRVAVYDPRVEAEDLPRALGVVERSDVVQTLLATGTVDLGALLREARPGVFCIPSAAPGGPPLQEYHYHVPFHALREGVDCLVVDSSSTLAGLNRDVIRSAEAVLFLVAADRDDVAATLGQVERMVLAPAGIPMDRVTAVLVERSGRAPAKLAELPCRRHALAHPPSGLIPGELVLEKAPDSALARDVERLAASLVAGHAVEVILTLPQVLGEDEARQGAEGLLEDFPALVQGWRLVEDAPSGLAEGSGASWLVLHGSADPTTLRETLGRLVDALGGTRARLRASGAHLRVEGRLHEL